MAFTAFNGQLDGQSDSGGFKEFTGHLDHDLGLSPPRRGGVRSEFKPYVAGGAAGAGRGFVQPLMAGPDEALAAEAAHPEAFRPLTLEQTGKDFQASVEQAKGLAEGAKLFFQSAGFERGRALVDQLDRIDAGQPLTIERTPGSAVNASPVHSWVRTYEGASPQGRAQLRARLAEGLARDRDVIADSVKAINAYKAEAQRLTGRTPEFTDISDAKDFMRWLVRTNVTNSATTAASIAGAALGAPALAVTLGGMAIGDLQGDVAEYAGHYDPQRFTNPDRRDAAAAAQPDVVANRIADSRGTVAAAAVPYAALDVLDPSVVLARSLAKP